MTVLQPVDPKPKLQSWTLWWSVILEVASVLNLTVIPLLPHEASWVGILAGIVGGILRFKTSKPII